MASQVERARGIAGLLAGGFASAEPDWRERCPAACDTARRPDAMPPLLQDMGHRLGPRKALQVALPIAQDSGFSLFSMCRQRSRAAKGWHRNLTVKPALQTFA